MNEKKTTRKNRKNNHLIFEIGFLFDVGRSFLLSRFTLYALTTMRFAVFFSVRAK